MWRRSAERCDPGLGWTGCLGANRFGHDVESFVDRCLIRQQLPFRLLMNVDKENDTRRHEQGGEQQPRQQALTPVGLFLGNQKIKLVFSDGQSS